MRPVRSRGALLISNKAYPYHISCSITILAEEVLDIHLVFRGWHRHTDPVGTIWILESICGVPQAIKGWQLSSCPLWMGSNLCWGQPNQCRVRLAG